MKNILITISSIAGLFILLYTPKNNTPWHIGMSAPANYPISRPSVSYFTNGKFVSATNVSFNILQDWGQATEIRSADTIVLPDSIYVSYCGLNNSGESWLYEGGAKLPSEKLQHSFETGFLKNNIRVLPNIILAGMAPQGNVCIWAGDIEITRFKVKAIKKINGNPIVYSSTGYTQQEEAKNVNKYLKNHPVESAIWETPDKRYTLDFGFRSENTNAKFVHSVCLTKEGGVYSPTRYTEEAAWQVPYGKPDQDLETGYVQYGEEEYDYKLPLPVHMVFSWSNKQNVYFSSDVVMPADLPKRFENAYVNPQSGKETHYNRIVIGVEKDGQHAIMWLDGPGRQEKIMRFKGKKGLVKDEGLLSGGYAEDVTYY